MRKPKVRNQAQTRKAAALGSVANTSGLPQIEDEFSYSPEILRKLSRHIQLVREMESKRVAREIHDELGQALTALKMDISWISHKIAADEGNKTRLLEKTGAMSELVDKTIRVVQKICAELRPGLLDDLGLVPAIEWQAQEFETRSGIKCTTRMEAAGLEISPDCSTAIFRIVQEALTNIFRHAQATRVSIVLREGEGRLNLVIKDNGVGISREDVYSPESLGLIGMRERLVPFSGVMEIKGVPGRGTMLEILIPIIECRKYD